MARMEKSRGARRVWVGIPAGKNPLERHRSRWEDNIKITIQKIVWGRGLHLCGSGIEGHDVDVYGRTISEWILLITFGGGWNGLIWLRKMISGGLL